MTLKNIQNLKVSIIIPVFNGEKTIRNCLQSVFRSDYFNFEVIVVDDGSTDMTPDQVDDSDCRFIRQQKNEGPAAARNRGAEKAQGDIFFFLDADITIEPDTVSRIVRTFEMEPAISALFCSYQKETPVDDLCSKYKNLLHHYTHQISKEEASTFCGGFGAIKRNIFFEFVGFDPACRFLEDIELGYRLHQAGHRILLQKEIQLTHHKRYSLWGLIKSDVLGRAKPWTEIMLKKRIFKRDLNTRIENVLSVPISFGILACLPISLFRMSGIWVFLILFGLYLLLNHRFFIFLLNEKGITFLLKSIPLNWFGYLYSGVGLIMGIICCLNPTPTKGDPTCC